MIDEDADASATPRNSTPNGVSEIIEKVRDDQDWKDVVFLMWNEQKIADPADINELLDKIKQKALTLQRAEQDKKVKDQKLIDFEIVRRWLNHNFQSTFKDGVVYLGKSYSKDIKELEDKIFGAGHRTSSSSQTKEELSSGGKK